MRSVSRPVIGSRRTVEAPRAVAALGLLGALLLSACGEGAGGTPVAAGTVTVTETVEVVVTREPSAAQPGASSGAGASTASPADGGIDSNVSDVAMLEPGDASLEAGIDAAGAVAAVGFRDFNGDNTVVLREVDDGDSRRLSVDHVAYYAMTDEREVLREVRDGVEDCDGDLTAEFLAGSLAVHDDDRDDKAEVTVAYRLACRTDVSAAEQKLVVLEDGEKYILRGSTSTPFEAFEDPVAEPAASSWPSGVHERALLRYIELAPEFTEMTGG